MEGQDRGRGFRGTNYYIQKLQGYIIQHGKYSQHFLINVNGV